MTVPANRETQYTQDIAVPESRLVPLHSQLNNTMSISLKIQLKPSWHLNVGDPLEVC